MMIYSFSIAAYEEEIIKGDPTLLLKIVLLRASFVAKDRLFTAAEINRVFSYR